MPNDTEAVLSASPDARNIYEYDVPDDIDPKIKTIGLVKMTALEEKQAVERVTSAQGLFFELAKSSLYEVDGARVFVHDGSLSAAWNKMEPALRNTIVTEYKELCIPDEKALAVFQKSRRVRVA